MHLLAALFAAAPLAGATPVDVAELAWMAGHWRSAADGRVSEELWMAPAGGLMLGLNRTVSASGTAFEFLRIATDGDALALLASPQGQAPVRFALEASGPGWVRFGNPAHDYPTVVSYRAQGTRGLRACIGDGTRESCWSWQRVHSADGAPE